MAGSKILLIITVTTSLEGFPQAGAVLQFLLPGRRHLPLVHPGLCKCSQSAAVCRMLRGQCSGDGLRPGSPSSPPRVMVTHSEMVRFSRAGREAAQPTPMQPRTSRAVRAGPRLGGGSLPGRPQTVSAVSLPTAHRLHTDCSSVRCDSPITLSVETAC